MGLIDDFIETYRDKQIGAFLRGWTGLDIPDRSQLQSCTDHLTALTRDLRETSGTED